MNENTVNLFEAFGGIGDDLVADSEYTTASKKNRHILRYASLAACLCLILAGTLHVLVWLDYFGAHCGSYPGKITDGDYYYEVPQHGVYRYSEGESEFILSKYFFTDWDVDSYGLYYRRGRTLYVIPHDTGKTEVLFTLPRDEGTHIIFDLFPNGILFVTACNKNAPDKVSDNIKNFYLLIDGRSGDVIKKYDSSREYCFAVFYTGERRITYTGDNHRLSGELLEDGKTLLPEGYECSPYPDLIGDCLLFSIYPTDADSEEHADNVFLFCRPDGEDTVLTIPGELSYISTGTADFLFATNFDDRLVFCIDSRTGEAWALEADVSCGDFYSLVSDGAYLYSSAPWSEGHSLWQIVYEDGRPASLLLLRADITE